MSIVIHTVTVTHTTDADNTYAFTGAPAARDFAQIVRKQGLKAKAGSVTVYSLEDNLVAFNSIEKVMRAVVGEDEMRVLTGEKNLRIISPGILPNER